MEQAFTIPDPRPSKVRKIDPDSSGKVSKLKVLEKPLTGFESASKKAKEDPERSPLVLKFNMSQLDEKLQMQIKEHRRSPR